MTRLAFIGDVHIGNHGRCGGARVSGLNVRCREALAVLQRACEAAHDNADALVIAGDLFDSARPSPQMITAVMDALDEAPTTYIIPGNHDACSTAAGDHALGPLDALEHVTVVDAPAEHASAFMLPYRPGSVREWLPAALETAPPARTHFQLAAAQRVPRVLVGHWGIADAQTAAWLRDGNDAIDTAELTRLLRRHGFAMCFAGHWHQRRRVDLCMQIGALVPTGYNNPGIDGYGSVIIWDSDSHVAPELIELAGPRFVQVTGSLVCPPTAALLADPLRVEWKVPPDQVAAATAEASDVDYHCDVVPDVAVACEQLNTAAAVVAAATTLSEAAVGYVDAMPLDEEINRADVRERTLGYLGVGDV